MFARVHTLDVPPGQPDEGQRVLVDEVLPWLRDSTGFRGVMRLADRTSGKVLVLTFWANDESLRASAAAAERLGELATAGVGEVRRALEDYEVTLFDVRSGERPS